MKLLIPATALLSLVLLSSCSSMYRAGQTPDDVYYSPSEPAGAVGTNNRNEYAYTNPDDNYLRMKVQNRNRWNSIDDANYWYSYNQPFNNLSFYQPGMGFGYNPFFGNSFGLGFNNFYGPSYFGGYPFWNTFNWGHPGFYGSGGYPGYYGHGFYGGYYPGTVVIRNLRSNTGPKPYMGGYRNNNFNNNNYPANGRSNSGLGRFINGAVGNQNNGSKNPNSVPSYNNEYNRPVRTFTPAPSSSGGSSRSTGSSTGGGRGGRGGR